jgi:hypothetical protein
MEISFWDASTQIRRRFDERVFGEGFLSAGPGDLVVAFKKFGLVSVLQSGYQVYPFLWSGGD